MSYRIIKERMEEHGSCNCSIIVLRLGKLRGTGVLLALPSFIREKGADAMAVTPEV